MDFREYGIMLMSEKNPPKWVELTKCNLDLTDAAYFKSRISNKRSTDEILVPIKSVSNVDSQVHMALLQIKDKESVRTYNELLRIEDALEILKFTEANREILYRENVVVMGLAQNWMDQDKKEMSKLREVYPNLFDEYVIIEEGAKPSKLSILLLPSALVLLFFLTFRKKFGKKV